MAWATRQTRDAAERVPANHNAPWSRPTSKTTLLRVLKHGRGNPNQQTSSESEPQGEAEEEQEQELEQEQEQWSTAPHYPVTLSDMSATSPPNLESTRVIKHGRGNRMLFSR